MQYLFSTQSASTELKDAIKNNQIEKVKELLDAAPKLVLQKIDENECTALMLAASEGRLEICRLLLAAQVKSNLDAVNIYGYTTLMVAATNGYSEIIKALLAAHPKPNLEACEKNYGWTALMLAARANHVESVQALLEANPNLAQMKNANNQTALDIAKEYGCTKVIDILKATKSKDDFALIPFTHPLTHQQNLGLNMKLKTIALYGASALVLGTALGVPFYAYYYMTSTASILQAMASLSAAQWTIATTLGIAGVSTVFAGFKAMQWLAQCFVDSLISIDELNLANGKEKEKEKEKKQEHSPLKLTAEPVDTIKESGVNPLKPVPVEFRTPEQAALSNQEKVNNEVTWEQILEELEQVFPEHKPTVVQCPIQEQSSAMVVFIPSKPVIVTPLQSQLTVAQNNESRYPRRERKKPVRYGF